MEITIMQAIVIFWSSLLVWVVVEYLFYRVQHQSHNNAVHNSLAAFPKTSLHQSKDVHTAR